MGRVEGVALLEEGVSLAAGFEVSKGSCHSQCVLCLLLTGPEVNSQQLQQLRLRSPIMEFNSLKPNYTLSFIPCSGHVLSPEQKTAI